MQRRQAKGHSLRTWFAATGDAAYRNAFERRRMVVEFQNTHARLASGARNLMWRDTMRGWRAFALVFYLVVAALEFFEVLGDALGFTDLNSYAAFSGIAPEQEAQRLGSLILLSSGIFVAAAASAWGIHKKKTWTIRAGTLTGVLLVLYGMYQILSGLFILQVNTFSVILAGSIFGFAGLFSMWLVRQVRVE